MRIWKALAAAAAMCGAVWLVSAWLGVEPWIRTAAMTTVGTCCGAVSGALRAS